MRRAGSLRLLAVSLASALACACGTSVVAYAGGALDSGTANDGGSENDAGAGDAGPSSDAGTGNDAGSGNDAGNSSDAGNPADGGTAADAGNASDAGSGNDAGSSSDAGSGNDAGSGADAGAPGDAGPISDAGVTVGCGNGILEAGEECDDGNLTNYDGCSSICKLEESQRVDYLEMQFATDSVCTDNQLGGAILLTLGQNELQTALTGAVANGSVTILLQFLGITDPSSVNQRNLVLGILSGSPEEPAGAPTYNGASDLDWWYLPDGDSVDSNSEPLAQIAANIDGGTLAAGPGSITLNISFGSGVNPFALSNAVFKSTLGPRTTPTESSSGLPPGHLAYENVSPALTTLASFGLKTSAGAGTLCGNIASASLQQALLPSAVTQACTAYTASNSFLDLLVTGCSAFGIVQAVNPTQPDQIDTSQPVAGAGSPYTLSASSGVTVDTCKDRLGASVDLATCLNATAYSSYFKFATDRVIVRRQ